MPRVGCDTKPTQTTGWCPKTWPAPIITQQARVTDPLMVQCWFSFHDIDLSMGECLLLAGNSATYFEMPVRYQIKNCKCSLSETQKSKERKR